MVSLKSSKSWIIGHFPEKWGNLTEVTRIGEEGAISVKLQKIITLSPWNYKKCYVCKKATLFQTQSERQSRLLHVFHL